MAVARRDFASLAACFADDGMLVLGNRTYVGREDIAAGVAATLGTALASTQIPGPSEFEAADGDAATATKFLAETVAVVFHLQRATDGGEGVSVGGVRYLDTLDSTSGEWLISRREHVSAWRGTIV